MKILVLSSGGLDSTVLLYRAVNCAGKENVVALNLHYGQKHVKEAECARWQAGHLGITYYEEDLSSVFKFNPDCCALLQGSHKKLEHKSYAEQLQDLGGNGTVSAYVPYRNGLFLSYATAVAVQLGCDTIYYGAHRDDAAGGAYPDCTLGFVDAQMKAIEEGTAGMVKMCAPWVDFNKSDIVTAGMQLGMSHEEFEHTWSCYEGGEKPCGTCGTCIDRKEAFKANGIYDID